MIARWGLVMWIALPAHAQDGATAQARARFEAGQAAVAAGEYERAYSEFEAGFALSGRALFVFNMAECARLLERAGDARRDYRRYLELAPEGAMAATARERLDALGPEPIERIVITADDVERVELDRAPPPIAPVPTVVPPRELWETWEFWAIGGAALAVVVGLVVGIAAGASAAGGPACGTGCQLVDFRM